MKKLMIAAAIVCAAVISQGAQCYWGMTSDSVAGPVGGDNTDGEGYLVDGTIFLYLGEVAASDTAFDFSKATYLDVGTMDGETYHWGSADTRVELAGLTSTAADQAFSLILVDQAGLTKDDLLSYEGDYVLYTGKSTQGSEADSQGGGTLYFADFTDMGSTYEGSWQKMEAVPEPTTGLLMLLGMGALALRRRRA